MVGLELIFGLVASSSVFEFEFDKDELFFFLKNFLKIFKLALVMVTEKSLKKI